MSTVSIQLPEETERRLRAQASHNGITLELLLRHIAEREAIDPLADGITWLTDRTSADVEAARNRLLGQPVHSLPPGKSLVETVEGTWPGDESDEVVRAALDRLS